MKREKKLEWIVGEKLCENIKSISMKKGLDKIGGKGGKFVLKKKNSEKARERKFLVCQLYIN